MNEKLLSLSQVTPGIITGAAKQYSTPFYLYDEKVIEDRCDQLKSMPNPFGLKVSFAMKANSTRAILQIIAGKGLDIDASSLNEVKRAQMAGIRPDRILLTTQEVPLSREREDLERLMKEGLKYNVCSLRQLQLIADFAAKNKIPLSMRVHPGKGSGESITRNTGDKYSCFGIHLSVIEQALEFARSKGVVFERVHVHIGSGGDPEVWRENIDLELGFTERYFPDATIINFGGGLREARMPDESRADIQALGAYAKKRIEEFHDRTGRKLTMEIEPGTYAVALSGFLVTSVMDKKDTGTGGFRFLVVDGGMETNARPLLYGSRHPFFVVSKDGRLLSGEFSPSGRRESFVVAGRCCESGDTLTLDDQHHIVERSMAEPEVDDFLVLGGCGAYCSTMTPFNYNSHTQIPEILLRKNGDLVLIRKAQDLAQMVQNEVSLT
ncbi:MAG: diaminopimelate decarboxylase [Spirochaetales bacterium]|nr:diaminopimelate decarboxylase [Spirochaetales bacterium]